MILFLNKRQTPEARRINFNSFFDLHNKYGKLCACGEKFASKFNQKRILLLILIEMFTLILNSLRPFPFKMRKIMSSCFLATMLLNTELIKNFLTRKM